MGGLVFTRHDHAHCKQSKCKRKDDCFRYQLYLEDERNENIQDELDSCSYFIISEEQSEHCTAFIQKR